MAFLLLRYISMGDYFKSSCWGYKKKKNIEQHWWKGNAAIKQSGYNWEKNDNNSEAILARQKIIIYFLVHLILLTA